MKGMISFKKKPKLHLFSDLEAVKTQRIFAFLKFLLVLKVIMCNKVLLGRSQPKILISH